ncbi:hypothetical protein [Silvimonas sp.]|uniref:hypothetical protein n=1 Tax=Silvimonas sp. TaxID=2650811 RepID=UPI00284D26AE|nr:hypothetical protein [Silvimonas sp.]MDR3427833.1 hypothetical protein [Silvimonas sp.]
MKLIYFILAFLYVFLWLFPVCCIGILSALCGSRRLDRWCERQFLDADGQPEGQNDQ